MDNNIWFALILLAVVIFLGLHEWRHERKLQKARESSGDINFDRCSEEELEAKVRELQSLTEGKEGRG